MFMKKKLAEEALRQSQQQYKNQLAYLNTLINTMNEFCLTYDRNAKLTFVNQLMLEILGYDLAEVAGQTTAGFFLPEENREFASQAAQKTPG